MTRQALFLTVPGGKPDPALEQGLAEGGCEVKITENVMEALQLLRSADARASAGMDGRSNGTKTSLITPIVILAATVRAGAIPLLTLLRELGVPTPWTLVYDEDGNDIHTIIKALQLGAREYVLASDPEVQRRLNARLLVERASTRATVDLATAPAATPPPALAAASPFSMEWDPIGRVIHIGEKYLRLSSVEARIFDRMLANRAHTVGVADLVSDALMQPNLEASVGARRLRPHVMRLRRKLERFPVIGMRIVNIRGTGYMMIESAIC